MLDKMWAWIQEHRKYIIGGVVVYMLHLTIEGVLVNIFWYTCLKPLITTMI